MAQGYDDTASELAVRLRAALETRDVDGFGRLLADDVRWGGAEETPETCHSRSDVLDRLAGLDRAGVERAVLEVVPGVGAVLVGFRVVNRPEPGASRRERTVYQVMAVRGGQITDIRGYPDRALAAAQAGIATINGHAPMHVRAVTPILNVSDLSGSFDWFAKLGWTRRWDWAAPGRESSFGSVGCDGFELFLCLNGQGGRGRGSGPGDGGQGVWLSVWVDDVDALHGACVREGLEVMRPPQDETWGVREMHVRHPDGHVFRISQERHHDEHDHHHEHEH